MIVGLAVVLAALLTGFAGLAFELACVRRTGLLLGHGSVGQALVFGAFLLGLGLGAQALAARRRLDAQPLRAAGMLYAIVAVALPLSFWVLERARPDGGAWTALACFAAPLAVAFFMGGAFPLALIGASRAWHGRGIGLLQGSNLLGSVAGAGVGGAFLLPHAGLDAVVWLASLGYGVAALLCLLVRRCGVLRSSARTVRSGKLPLGAVAASGACVLGLELWMPRRLTFFLGGFLPTLSGTLVAALLGLALGSIVADWIPRRAGDRTVRRAAAASVVGVGLSVLLVELVGPVLATWRVTTELGAITLASTAPFLLTLPATLPLGAILPLALRGSTTRAEGLDSHAGASGFLAFSMGAFAASLLVPFVFELPSPLRFAPIAASLPLAVCARGPGLLAAVLAILVGVVPFQHRPALVGARFWPAHQVRKRVVAERSDRILTASVVEDRVVGERLLYTDEFAAAGGVSSSYMRALGLLPAAFAPTHGTRVVICLGTGTTAAALARATLGQQIDIVELSPAVVACSADFADATRVWQPRARVLVCDGRRDLETRRARSVGCVTLEPLLPQALGSVHLYSREFYGAVRRVLVDSGVCMQWLPTHALDPSSYRALLRTFLDAFPHARAFLIDNSTLLLGFRGPVRRPRTFAGVDAYLCGLATQQDLDVAELDVDLARRRVAQAEIVVDERPFLETRGHAEPRAILDWLPTNLGLFAAAEAMPRARALRLEAKRLLARARLDPWAARAAAVRLADASELRPQSLLLRQELRAARAVVARANALQALAQKQWQVALEACDRAIGNDAATPLLLAARVVALWRTERREAALRAVRELHTLFPSVLRLASVQTRRAYGLKDLWTSVLHDELRAGGSEPGSLSEREFVAAWVAGDVRAKRFLLQRPKLGRWLLMDALRRGLELTEEVGRRLPRNLDGALLESLQPWVLLDQPRHLAWLARCFAADSPLPRWWAPLVDWLAELEHGDLSRGRVRELWVRIVRLTGYVDAEGMPVLPPEAPEERRRVARLLRSRCLPRRFRR